MEAAGSFETSVTLIFTKQHDVIFQKTTNFIPHPV
jgi:hypothetical protein